jgi:hypothetical protein
MSNSFSENLKGNNTAQINIIYEENFLKMKFRKLKFLNMKCIPCITEKFKM